jgi:AcrR family transcriptional regulator
MSAPLTKRQRRAAATSEQLLLAAREVFEARGFVATSVGAITEAANTAHGTFYLYFKNKEDAFARLMGEVTGEMYREARPVRAADRSEAVEAAIRNYLTVFNANRGLWRCLIEGTHHSPAVEKLWRGLRRPFIERIETGLEHLVSIGAVREMDTSVAAQALGSMVEWFAFAHIVLQEPPGTRRTLDEVAHTLTDLWMHAVFGTIQPKPPA